MLKRWDCDSDEGDGLPRRYDESSSNESSNGSPKQHACSPDRWVVPRCTSSSSDGSGTDTDTETSRWGVADLTFDALMSHHVSGRVPQDSLTQYAEGGQARSRIKQAIRRPVCSCQCAVPLKLLLKLCVLFWTLPKSHQDSLLWALQSGDEKKRHWRLAGLRVKHDII